MVNLHLWSSYTGKGEFNGQQEMRIMERMVSRVTSFEMTVVIN